jgi:very-short-patch-repair endonuclease
MPLPFNPKLKKRARELRKNMTESEKTLWAAVRRKQLDGYQFYRQKNIGQYIVDFYCPAAKLVVEVDGGGHHNEKADAYDGIRDNYLRKLGFTVLRVPSDDIFSNLDTVLQKIQTHLQKTPKR